MSIATVDIISKVVNIAQDFTDTPGFRYEKQGPFSGEEFRKKFLEPYFEDKGPKGELEIIFDGTAGYSTSFLEEAFGGLVRKLGYHNVMPHLKLTSNEDSVLIEDVKKYMEEAKN